MKTFYHHDNDGRCAAYIVSKYTGNRNLDDYIEITYDQPIPFERLSPDEDVYIVDFSFFPEDMDKLLAITKNVVWIDHHVSAIKRFADYHTEIKGIRNEGEEAGCALTWKFLFPDKEMPDFVRLASDYDIWKFEFGDRTRHFNVGTQVLDTHPIGPTWCTLEDQNTLNKLIKTGKDLSEFRAKLCTDQIKRFGYEIMFHGHRCLVLNTAMFGSQMFDSVRPEYDICIMITYDGKAWKVGMYSDKIDTHIIAMMYDGGGHPGASGFTVEELPYEFHDPKS